MRANEGSGGRNRPRISVGMGSWCKGGPGLNGPRPTCWPRMTPSPRFPGKSGRGWVSWLTKDGMLSTQPRRNSCQTHGTPACETGLPAGGERNQGLRASPTDALRVIRVRGYGKALHRDRGAGGSEVSLLRCSRCGHPSRTHLSQSRAAGELARTTSPRDLPRV